MALKDSLISHWKMNEASGDAVDAYGSNTLTDNNTVGSATGKIGNARDFELANLENFSIADNTSLSTGDIDFSIACWVQLESKPAGGMGIICKSATSLNCEYRIAYSGAADRFRFTVSSDGTTLVNVTDSVLGSPSTGVWYFIVAWHDATANTINIQVNNGAGNSAAHSTGVLDGGAAFRIGDVNNNDLPYDGLVDEVSFWKRVLAAAERTQLYNSGNGLSFDLWDVGNLAHRRLSGAKYFRRFCEMGREGVTIA